MSESSLSTGSAKRRAVYVGITLLALFACYFYLAHGPIRNGIRQRRESSQLQMLHGIGLAMYSYANDYGGNYPDGKSSTEVFQKLVDGDYVTNPDIFYLPATGKTKPIAGQKLKPENVCFDVTAYTDTDAPAGLPIVFLTGYKVSYAADGAAVPLTQPAPAGIVVFYKDNSAKVLMPGASPADGSIPNFVPPEFNANGKTYRQLTPDGPVK